VQLHGELRSRFAWSVRAFQQCGCGSGGGNTMLCLGGCLDKKGSVCGCGLCAVRTCGLDQNQWICVYRQHQ